MVFLNDVANPYDYIDNTSKELNNLEENPKFNKKYNIILYTMNN